MRWSISSCASTLARSSASCVDSAASGRSLGDCWDYAGAGEWCARCYIGGKSCAEVPLVLRPLAARLLAARSAESERAPRCDEEGNLLK